ncbi:MAG: DNA repair protein RecO [Gemmatimonadales bacterium]
MVSSPAIVLSTVAYGETSKIARLATRALGVVSVIAKGARRPKSRFGAALQALSEGAASIIPARSSDLHTLATFDVERVHSGLAAPVDRFAAASVLGELMLRCAPHHGPPETYDFFRHALDVLEAVPSDAVGVIGLRTVWGLVGQLGYTPRLEHCVRDGLAVPLDRPAAFSAALGGVLCGGCARGLDTTRLEPADRSDLATLVAGDADLPDLDDRYLAAHRRLVDRYVRHHLAEGAALPALAFWLDQSWAPTP